MLLTACTVPGKQRKLFLDLLIGALYMVSVCIVPKAQGGAYSRIISRTLVISVLIERAQQN